MATAENLTKPNIPSETPRLTDYNRPVAGFDDWVPCPVHGREIPYIRKRRAAFCARCGWIKVKAERRGSHP